MFAFLHHGSCSPYASKKMKFLLHHTISRAMINVMLLIKATTQLYTKNGKYLSCVYAAMTTADAAPATTEQHIYLFSLLFTLWFELSGPC